MESLSSKKFNCLEELIVQDVFVADCAQGQTLPLTGEGIRRSLFYRRRLGTIIQKILDIASGEGAKAALAAQKYLMRV